MLLWLKIFLEEKKKNVAFNFKKMMVLGKIFLKLVEKKWVCDFPSEFPISILSKSIYVINKNMNTMN